jgi:hypothetical protein
MMPSMPIRAVARSATQALGPPRREDLMEAIRIRASLSTALISAAGTAIAGGLALVAFATSLHRVPPIAIVLWSIAGTALFVSAFSGGMAIRHLTRQGSEGSWPLLGPSRYYGGQVGAFALGAALLAAGSIAAFAAPSRGSQVSRQDGELSDLRDDLRQSRATVERLEIRLREVEDRVRP